MMKLITVALLSIVSTTNCETTRSLHLHFPSVDDSIESLLHDKLSVLNYTKQQVAFLKYNIKAIETSIKPNDPDLLELKAMMHEDLKSNRIYERQLTDAMERKANGGDGVFVLRQDAVCAAMEELKIAITYYEKKIDALKQKKEKVESKVLKKKLDAAIHAAEHKWTELKETESMYKPMVPYYLQAATSLTQKKLMSVIFNDVFTSFTAEEAAAADAAATSRRLGGDLQTEIKAVEKEIDALKAQREHADSKELEKAIHTAEHAWMHLKDIEANEAAPPSSATSRRLSGDLQTEIKAVEKKIDALKAQRKHADSKELEDAIHTAEHEWMHLQETEATSRRLGAEEMTWKDGVEYFVLVAEKAFLKETTDRMLKAREMAVKAKDMELVQDIDERLKFQAFLAKQLNTMLSEVQHLDEDEDEDDAPPAMDDDVPRPRPTPPADFIQPQPTLAVAPQSQPTAPVSPAPPSGQDEVLQKEKKALNAAVNVMNLVKKTKATTTLPPPSADDGSLFSEDFQDSKDSLMQAIKADIIAEHEAQRSGDGDAFDEAKASLKKHAAALDAMQEAMAEYGGSSAPDRRLTPAEDAALRHKEKMIIESIKKDIRAQVKAGELHDKHAYAVAKYSMQKHEMDLIVVRKQLGTVNAAEADELLARMRAHITPPPSMSEPATEAPVIEKASSDRLFSKLRKQKA